MNTAKVNRTAAIFDEIARGVNLDRTLALIAEQVATEMGAPTCKIWVVKRGDMCERCLLAFSCTNREICLHLAAASGAAMEKEYPRIPLSIFSAPIISRGGTLDFSDQNGVGDRLFGLQHGANEGGRDSFAISPLRGPSGILGVIGVFNHRPIEQTELRSLARFAPSAVAAIRVAELQSRYDLLRGQFDKLSADAENDALKCADLEAQIKELKALQDIDHSKVQSEIARLQSEREAVVLESVEAIRRAEMLEEEVQSLRERAEELMSLQEESGRAYSEWAAQIETERTRLDEKNASLEEKIKLLEEAISEHSTARDETSHQIAERNLAIEGLRTELEVKQAELADSREAAARLQARLTEVVENNTALRDQNVAISEGLDDLERSLRIAEDARARSEQIRVGLAAKVADLTVEMEKLRVENGRVADENEQLIAEIERVKREFSGLRTHSEKLGEENAALKASTATAGQAKSRAELRLAELEQENALLLQTNTQLEENGRRFEAMALKLDETNHKMRDRIEASEKSRSELEQRNRVLSEQNRRLQIESRGNARFLANMSHELRTPMNAIIGFTTLLVEDTALQLSDRHRRNLERISRNARDLLQLINNVLDLSKLDSGRMEVFSEAAEIRDLVERALIIVEPLKQGRLIEVKTEFQEGLPTIRTDRTKLQQVLINLLSNAIKFTPKGEVRISAESAGPDRVKIAVRDTGVGIAEQDIPKIFEEFRQLRGPGTHGGSGLGLTIALRLAELMGGTIAVSSKLGEGSIFTLTIPVHVEGVVASEVEPEAADETHRALVFEQNPASLYLTKKYLAELGYSVSATDDLEKALAMLHTKRPALVTIGAESADAERVSIEAFIRQIPPCDKADKGDEACLVIAIIDSIENGHLALSTGAQSIVRRPFERTDLQLAIQRARNRNLKRILVIDDDQDALDLLTEVLDGRGFETHTAADGRKALELLETWRPDVILLDLMLPEMDGFEVINRIRLSPETQNIPIILTTARDLTREEREILSLSGVRPIQKGDFGRDELVVEINQGIKRSEEAARAAEAGNILQSAAKLAEEPADI